MSNPSTNQQQQQAQALRILAQQQQIRLQNPNGTPKAGSNADGSTASTTGGLTLPPGLSNVNIGQLLELARKGQLNPAQMEQFRALMAYAPQMQAQLSSQRASPASTSTPTTASAALPQTTSTPQSSQYAPSNASPSPVPARPSLPNTTTPAGTTAAPNSNSQQMAALALFRSLQGMSEEQRQKTFTSTPKLLSLWNHYTAQLARGTLAGSTSTSTAGGSNSTSSPGTSGLQGMNSPALPNLQLPPGRARNPALQQPTAGGMANRPLQTQPARPPLNGGGLSRQGTPHLQQQQAGGSVPAVGNEPIPITRPPLQTSSSMLPNYKTTPSPHPNAMGARPTLSTGLAAGPSLGTPSLVARSGGGWDEASRAGSMGGQKKDEVGGNGAGDWTKDGRKRKLREVMESVDKGEKLEDEVEDLILEMVDELIDSATHFAARLAKHRKSNVLEVKDLQLHFEMHHNIRVPGLASDEIRQAQSQATRRTNVLSQHVNRVAAVNAARAANTALAEKEAAAAVKEAARVAAALAAAIVPPPQSVGMSEEVGASKPVDLTTFPVVARPEPLP